MKAFSSMASASTAKCNKTSDTNTTKRCSGEPFCMRSYSLMCNWHLVCVFSFIKESLKTPMTRYLLQSMILQDLILRYVKNPWKLFFVRSCEI